MILLMKLLMLTKRHQLITVQVRLKTVFLLEKVELVGKRQDISSIIMDFTQKLKEIRLFQRLLKKITKISDYTTQAIDKEKKE